ncbi:cupin domain-containing protein [bacterium]|nr:cupin domain-containing protein [bacterium]
MAQWWKAILRGPIPASLGVCAVFVLLAAWLTPAGEPPRPGFYDCPGALHPGDGANVTTAAVGAYESASVHHLLVAEGVKTHFHRNHDETVTVLSGTGRVRLGDDTREVTAGTVLLIPRGTLHSLEVTAGPVEALSAFSPAFDGKDRIYVDE